MTDELDDFYDRLRTGLPVSEFFTLKERVHSFVRSENLIHDYRLGKGRLKRLRDEVVPAASFVKCCESDKGKIQFPLDDSPADCNLWDNTNKHRKIQITLIQGKEYYVLMDKLNKTGTAPGFLGLSDVDDLNSHRAALEEGGRAYDLDEIKDVFSIGLKERLANKSMKQGADTLLVGGPLDLLAEEDWERMNLREVMQADFQKTAFLEIYLVGSNICLKLK